MVALHLVELRLQLLDAEVMRGPLLLHGRGKRNVLFAKEFLLEDLG